MIRQSGFRGIAFPFNFSSSGSVKTSETNENDLTHIKEEIEQRLLTRKGERVNRPDFGSEVYKLLHRTQDDSLLGLVKEYTRRALEPMSDRIKIIGIEAYYESSGDNSISDTIIVELNIFVVKYLVGDAISVSYSTNKEE